MKRLFLILAILSASAFGQGTVSHLRYGSSLPAACSPTTGDVFFKTASPIGVHFCSASNTWTPPSSTIHTTKGDLFTFSTTPTRLGVGANGTCLLADSTQTTGIKWDTCPGASAGTVTSIATTSPITGGTITTTGTIACATCAIGPGASTANHLVKFTGTDGITLGDGGAIPTGTVTSIATTSPLGGGTITGTGTLTCTTCVTASSPGAGVAHFAGSTQAVTSSAIVGADMTNNTVTSTQLAVVNTRRTCSIVVGSNDAGSALTNANLGPQSRLCFVPYAATIKELTVSGDAGTPNVIVGVNHAGSISNIVSGALATASSGGIACSNTGGTTGINGATTCSSTLQNTSVAAGDYLELVSGTAGGTAKQMSIQITYTVN